MVQRIPLSGKRGAGLYALVDDEDAELVRRHRWHARVCSNTTYAYGWVNGQYKVLMHVLIMGQRGIDHKDGDGLNNRRANLRIATVGQNNANSRPRIGTSSPYKGVTWSRREGKWLAQMRVEGRTRCLGYFADEVTAARAYDAAALEAWGEYARPNFPPS